MIEAIAILAVFGIPAVIVAAILIVAVIAAPFAIYNAIQLHKHTVWNVEQRTWIDTRSGREVIGGRVC